MTEAAPEATAAVTEAPAEAPETDPATEWQDKYKGQQKVNRDLERKLREAQTEIEKARTAGLSDAEKAVAEAEARGRQAATSTFGQRLASAEFVAAAARRNAEFDATAVLDDLNLAKYVTDDGEPDTKGISEAVARLVPEPNRNPRPSGDADLGPRPDQVAYDESPRGLIAAGLAATSKPRP